MIRSKLMALTVSGVLSVSSMAALAQSSGAPVDKGGMPPSTEMNAGSGDGKALSHDSVGGGNAGDENGSSTSPGAGSGSMSGGSSTGSGSGGGSGGSGSSGGGTGESGG